MNAHPTRRALAALCIAACAAVTACAPTSSGDRPTIDCATLASETRAELRNREPGSPRIDQLLSELTARCSAEYSEIVEEISRQSVDDAIAKYRSDSPRVAGSIDWSEAVDHVGRRATVCGPLVNDGTSRDDVFLNLGRGYPDKKRFQIVLWDVGAVEEIPRGTTLCTTGVITLYRGVAQIELDDPSEVKILD